MKIFDKAAWHIDAGEEKIIVLKRFELLLNYLKKNEMLTPYGLEIFDLGVDSQISLTDKMVNKTGCDFLDKNIDKVISSGMDEISKMLN